MFNKYFIKRNKQNEGGFTIVEMLIASAMSVIVLGLLAHVFRTQQKEFDTQTGLNTMQANGRAATEFISRSVQNAGFNVKRGTRFLSASDHYLTAVYDANDDNVIQNDEIITYSVANTWTGTANENHSFVAWFDVDGDGTIETGENPTMTVGMNVTGPPFNLYKVTPNAAGTGIERSLVARNIDNMVIKYYDKDGNLLPVMSDTDDDGVGNITFNGNADDQPDGGNWTFRFPIAELNDIRRVEVEILARARNADPRERTFSGTYLPGSIAAVSSGSTTYSDKFFREDFTSRMAPRNLIMAPWGNIDIVAAPPTVDCPNAGSVTATLLDKNGEAVASNAMTFTATGTGVTLGSASGNTDANGQRTTAVNFDYSFPYYTSTISASAQVDDGTGQLRPVYNATPLGFTYGGTNFIDHFDGVQTQPWSDLGGGVLQFQIPPGEEYFESLLLSPAQAGALNGCGNWRDYAVQSNVLQANGTAWGDSDYMGLILRHQDANNYYWITIHKKAGGGTDRWLRVLKWVGGFPGLVNEKLLVNIPEGVGSGDAPAPFTDDVTYTLKAQMVGNDIRVKLWKPVDPLDPNASEPAAWEIGGTGTPVTDPDLTQGNFGVIARDRIFQFDQVKVDNADPI